MSVQPNRQMADYLSDLYERTTPVTWEEWLPVAAHAGREPEQFVATFTSLHLDAQFGLLESLKTSAGAPFSDLVVAALAARQDSIGDPQVREFVLDDSLDAVDRRQALINEQRAALEQLVGQVSERQEGEFDSAAAITDMEQQLQSLQLGELDSNFTRLHALERQVARLEALRRTLEGFDFEAGRKSVDDLSGEVDRLTAEKRTILNVISEATAGRERAERELDEARQQLELIVDEAANTRSALEGVNADRESRAAEAARSREEQRNVAAETRRLRDEQEELDARLEEDRRSLTELRESAARESAENIVRKIDEVFSLLPPDAAEKDFTSIDSARA